MTFVFDIPKKQAYDIIVRSPKDNRRFEIAQFDKLMGSDLSFCGLFADTHTCLAAAALELDRIPGAKCYVSEYQALVKGYGKPLLLQIIKKYKGVWLMANPDAGDKLVKYYRDSGFGFKEYALKHSVWGKSCHFFYTDKCDGEKLCAYLKDTYTGK